MEQANLSDPSAIERYCDLLAGNAELAASQNKPFCEYVKQFPWFQGMTEEIKQHIQRMLEQNPEKSDCYFRRAALYELEEDYLKALEFLQKAIEKLPASAPFPDRKYKHLARLHLVCGNVERAFEVYERVLNHYAGDVHEGVSQAYWQYGIMCMMTGNVEKLLDLARDVFGKLNSYISGTASPKTYRSGTVDDFLYRKDQFSSWFGKRAAWAAQEILEKGDLQAGKALLRKINEIFTPNTGDDAYFMEFTLAAALVCRLQKDPDHAWDSYMYAVQFCHTRKDLFKVYNGMGKLLKEEGKFVKLQDHYRSFVPFTKNMPYSEKLPQYIADFFSVLSHMKQQSS